jgi:hypothetical protein
MGYFLEKKIISIIDIVDQSPYCIVEINSFIPTRQPAIIYAKGSQSFKKGYPDSLQFPNSRQFSMQFDRDCLIITV